MSRGFEKCPGVFCPGGFPEPKIYPGTGSRNIMVPMSLSDLRSSGNRKIQGKKPVHRLSEESEFEQIPPGPRPKLEIPGTAQKDKIAVP